MLGYSHELIEWEAEVDLSLCEGIFCLGDVFGYLFLGLEDGLGERFDCIEELYKGDVTWSSWCSVQVSICCLSVAKLII